MNDSKNLNCVSLENKYKEMMSTFYPIHQDFSKWEKVGDRYKQFSIYDTSKYESISSLNVIFNK